MKYGILRIHRSTETPDFQKSGYWDNILIGLTLAPDNNLIPFYYAYAIAGSAITVTSFKLEHITRQGVVCTSYDLTSTWVTTESNDQNKIFRYDADQNILGSLTSYTNGIYRYKITVSTGKYFYSSPFKINDFKFTTVIGVGDFEHNDLIPADFY